MNYYEEIKNKIIKEEKLEVKDLVPDPILIKNKNNIEIITEKVLHNLILEDIPSFMNLVCSWITRCFRISSMEKYK